MRKCILVGVLVPIAIGFLATGPAGALSKAQLKAKALSLSDVPTGWSVNNATPASSGCAGGASTGRHDIRISVSYADGQAPELSERLETGPSVSGVFRSTLKHLTSCRTIKASSGGQTIAGTVGAMSFPTVGDSSAAYVVQLNDHGISLGVDLVFFKVGKYMGIISYGDLGTPAIGQLQGFVQEAISKILGKPVAPFSSTTNSTIPYATTTS